MDLLNATRSQIQTAIKHEVYERARQGARRILVQGATGIGKTYVIGSMIQGTLKKGRTAMVITPRRRITKQMHETMTILGLNPSYMMAGAPHDRASPLQVVCDATLKGRIRRAADARKSNNLLAFCHASNIKDVLPPADTIFVDECHIGDIHWLTELYPDSVIIGMTATPMKANGDGLGDQYETDVQGPTISSLIGSGLLLPAKVVSSEGMILPDRSDVDEVPLLGEVVENWLEHANGERTVLYAKSVLHSQHLCEKFNEAGIPAEHVDSTISDEPGEDGISERDRIYNRLASGEIKVLCNYGIVIEGVDIPSIGCVILARPNKEMTMGLITYLQAIGRARRPFAGHTHVTVIDHTRTKEMLGHPDKDWEWPLHTTKAMTMERIRKRAKEEEDEKVKKEKLLKCECGASYSPAPKCPECGRDAPKSHHVVEEIPMMLVPEGKGKKAQLAWDKSKVERLYCELMGAYKAKNDNGWLFHAKQCADRRIPEPLQLPWLEYKTLPPKHPTDEAIQLVNNERKAYWARKRAIDIKNSRKSTQVYPS